MNTIQRDLDFFFPPHNTRDHSITVGKDKGRKYNDREEMKERARRKNIKYIQTFQLQN